MRCSDSPPPVPPRFVAFAWRYPGRTRGSLPWPPGATGRGPGVGHPVLPPGLAEKAKGSPRFLGNPRERALFSDPGGIACARPLRRRDAAFRSLDNVGSREEIHFGAQSHGPFAGCLRFAVPVARAPRKTRFRPLARLCRAGVGTPQGSIERFPRYIASPFPKLSWRTYPTTRRGRPGPGKFREVYRTGSARDRKVGGTTRQAAAFERAGDTRKTREAVSSLREMTHPVKTHGVRLDVVLECPARVAGGSIPGTWD